MLLHSPFIVSGLAKWNEGRMLKVQTRLVQIGKKHKNLDKKLNLLVILNWLVKIRGGGGRLI